MEKVQDNKLMTDKTVANKTLPQKKVAGIVGGDKEPTSREQFTSEDKTAVAIDEWASIVELFQVFSHAKQQDLVNELKMTYLLLQ